MKSRLKHVPDIRPEQFTALSQNVHSKVVFYKSLVLVCVDVETDLQHISILQQLWPAMIVSFKYNNFSVTYLRCLFVVTLNKQ